MVFARQSFLFILVVLLNLAWGGVSSAQSSMADGFGKFGLQKARVKHAVKRVRLADGTMAERFELRTGDCNIPQKDCAHDRERVEFTAKGKMQRLGQDIWVGWSVYLPGDFPKQGRKMNVKLGQFHQLGGSGPELLFQLDDASYSAILKNPNVRDDDPMRPKGDFKAARLASRRAMLGKWNRIIVNARWSRGADGYISIWINGKKSWSYSGPTTNDTDNLYFRYGLYRSFVSRCGGPCPTLVAYYKDVRRGKNFNDVK